MLSRADLDQVPERSNVGLPDLRRYNVKIGDRSRPLPGGSSRSSLKRQPLHIPQAAVRVAVLADKQTFRAWLT